MKNSRLIVVLSNDCFLSDKIKTAPPINIHGRRRFHFYRSLPKKNRAMVPGPECAPMTGPT